MTSRSTSRRQFLKHSSLIALAPTIPSFLARSARGADAARDDKVLVVIQLDGGNDGINTVVPYKDEGYAANRKELRLPTDDLIKLNDQVALHPRLRSVSELLDDERLAIVQGVGYPNPNRSHFKSMAIWHSASFDEENHDGPGWIGQSLSLRGRESFSAAVGNGLRADPERRGGRSLQPQPVSPQKKTPDPLRGPDTIYVGHEELPVALIGRRCNAATIASEEDLRLTLDELGNAAAKGAADEDLSSFVQRSVLQAYSSARQLSTDESAIATDARYPNSKLGTQLKLTSALMKSGAAARVYYTSQPGYDTHAVQLPTHANLLGDFSASLKAFLDDLKTAGLDDRVLVLAFSEFGRRVRENGSIGTDHGTAGPVFLAGPNVKPGLHGKMPPLTDLADGDLKHTVDFRQVYASVLDDWLRLSRPDAVAGFEPLSIVKAV